MRCFNMLRGVLMKRWTKCKVFLLIMRGDIKGGVEEGDYSFTAESVK